MILLHVNVSLACPMSQQMLLSIATPYHLKIILQLLLIVPTDLKLNIIKILDGLHKNNLPQDLFEKAVEGIS